MSERDYAVVIGVDRYLDVNNFRPLPNSAQNALAFCDWLLYEARLPTKNVILLASLKDNAPTVEAGRLKLVQAADRDRTLSLATTSPLQGAEALEPLDANWDNISWAVRDIARRVKGVADRLFFYFSGHGLSRRVAGYLADAFVQSDYDKTDNRYPFSIPRLATYCLDQPFAEQVFILDCCRTDDGVPNDLEGFGRTPCDTKPAICRKNGRKQYFVWAAEKNSDAYALRGGAMTDKLLEGLRGAPGEVMRFVPGFPKDVYQVTMKGLDEYLAAAFREGTMFHQQSWIDGDRNGSKFPLATLLPGDPVKKIRLSIAAAPTVELKNCSFELLDQRNKDQFPADRRQTGPDTVEVDVYPQEYTLIVNCGVKAGTMFLECWKNPVEVRVNRVGENVRIEPGGRGGHETNQIGEDVSGLWLMTVLRDPDRATTVPATEYSNLVIHTKDSGTSLEVSDLADRAFVAYEKVSPEKGTSATYDFNNLKPGWYKARLERPGALATEKLIALAPLARQEETIELLNVDSSRLSDDVLGVVEDGDLPTAADYVGGVRSAGKTADLQNMLTLIADADDRGRTGKTPGWLARLGLPAQEHGRPNQAELEVILAVDTGNRPESRIRAARVEVRFWPAWTQPGPGRRLAESVSIPGLAWARFLSDEPGPHWFSVRLPEMDDSVFPIPRLGGFKSRLVLVQDATFTMQVYHYIVGRQPDRPPTPSDLNTLAIDESLLRAGRVSDVLELAIKRPDLWTAPPRAVGPIKLDPGARDGGAPDVFEQARRASMVRPIDPVTGCLMAGLLDSAQRIEPLGRLSARMLHDYPGLSDTHVIRAVYESEAEERDAPPQPDRYMAALKCGLPIDRTWFVELAAGVRRFGLEGREARLIAQVADRLPPAPPLGPLWTSWTPRDFRDEKPVEPA
jgi:hypothetical protein